MLTSNIDFQVLFIEEKPEFPGSRSQFVHKLQFLQPDLLEGIPVYRVMNRKGEIIDESQDPKVWYLLVFLPTKHRGQMIHDKAVHDDGVVTVFTAIDNVYNH